GYTDNTGDAAHNLKLSQGRADSVVAQLGTMGIGADRLVPKGYGEDHPVGDNATPEGRAQNRRISMLVTAK
ncbi:MAG: OmpA family protein, partial [Acidobacteriaceae bacterium]